mmetsp:Transcript_44297/g.140960  ORF Transcript_44297/g.140960 Transcript_44297/m.140960 type:complete len:872 (+) Transcript_44297:215-2830(+)
MAAMAAANYRRSQTGNYGVPAPTFGSLEDMENKHDGGAFDGVGPIGGVRTSTDGLGLPHLGIMAAQEAGMSPPGGKPGDSEDTFEERLQRRTSRVQDTLQKDATSVPQGKIDRRKSQMGESEQNTPGQGSLARRMSRAVSMGARSSTVYPANDNPLDDNLQDDDKDDEDMSEDDLPVPQMTRHSEFTRQKSMSHTKHLKTSGWMHSAGELLYSCMQRSACRWPIEVIDPNGFFKRNWDWVVVLFVLYVAVAVPYEACFLNQSKDWDDNAVKISLTVVSYTLDIIFITDIILNFRTAIVGGGVVIKDQQVIVHTYVQGWFFIDFIASIPFDWFFLGSSGGSELDYVALVKCTRLLRLGRLMRKLEQLAAANLFRIIKMVGAYMLFAHWIACGWYYVGVNGAQRSEPRNVEGVPVTDYINWLAERERYLVNEQGFESISIGKYYEVSYYWAVTTLTTVGYGDIVPQTVAEVQYAIVVQILGSVVFAVIFGNVAVLISSFDAAYSRYRDRMDRVNEFIDNNEIPSELRDRMRAYVDYLWNINKGLNVRDMVTELPDALKSEIYLHMYELMITSVPMFKEADKSLIKSLIVRLRVQVIFPGDLVVAEGDMGREMFFVRHGNVDVMSGDMETTYANLGEGSFFGEISLLTGGRRTATIMATEICEIYSLAKYDFDEVLQDFPEERAMFREIAQMRLKDNAIKRGDNEATDDEDEEEGGGDGVYENIVRPVSMDEDRGAYVGLESDKFARSKTGKFIMAGQPSPNEAAGQGFSSSENDQLPPNDALSGSNARIKAESRRRSMEMWQPSPTDTVTSHVEEGQVEAARSKKQMDNIAQAATADIKKNPKMLDDDALTRVGVEEIRSTKAYKKRRESRGE